jgi:PAS domain S-box-containing protein
MSTAFHGKNQTGRTTQYALAILATVVAAALRWLLGFAFGDVPPFVTFFPAVIVAALFGGLSAGLLSTLLSGVFAAALPIPPSGSLVIKHNDAAAIALFLINGALVTVVADGFRKKKIEAETARINEEQFRTLFEATGVGMAQADPASGRLLRANPKWLKMMGYEKEDLKDKTFSDLTHPEDRQKDWEAFSRLVRSNIGTYETEKRLIRKDGSIFWSLVTVNMVRDAAGKPVRTIAVVNDISDRKHSEAALFESEERFRTIFDRSPMGIALCDKDGLLVELNQAAMTLFGILKRQQVVGRLGLFSSPTVSEENRTRLKAGETVEQEIVCDFDRIKQSSFFDTVRSGIFHFSVTATPLTRGPLSGPSGYLLQAHDITERKRAEEQVHHQNTVLDSINNIFQEAFAARSEQELFTKCLAAAEAITESKFGFIGEIGPDGFIENRAMSNPGWELCSMKKQPDHGRSSGTFTVQGLYGSTIISGKRFFTNAPASHPDSKGLPEGHPPLTAFLAVPLVYGGKVFGMIGLGNREGGYRETELESLDALAVAIVQVLMSKRAEESIRKLNEDLKRGVDKLASSNKELEAFIYSVSHDLRGPLRSIAGFSEYLGKNYSNKLDTAGKNHLERIINAATHMDEIINDLLRLSRISQQPLARTDVDVSRICHSFFDELRKAQPDRNVAVTVKEGMIVSADQGLIELSLFNLLRNAWKFTSRTAHARIEVGTVIQNDKPVYFVKDNGAGFDQNLSDKLFLPFHRLHTEQEFQGTGIGLAIVERVICRHGGTIWAEGRKNEGAQFFFTLK